jgi:hypothetical protein
VRKKRCLNKFYEDALIDAAGWGLVCTFTLLVRATFTVVEPFRFKIKAEKACG